MPSEPTPPLAPSDRELMERAVKALEEWNEHNNKAAYMSLIAMLRARLAADEDAEYQREAKDIVKNIGWGVDFDTAVKILAVKLKARDQRRKEAGK